jgi:organic hydroperoxide reductase OsmC/OhrA
MEDLKYSFEINAVWSDDKTVQVSSPDFKEPITTTIPPPFTNGIGGHWSAEHLFLASLASCFAHTFQIIANLSELPFDSFTCNISGDAEKIDKVFAFHSVKLFPTLIIPLETYRNKAESVLEKAERNCIIANSVKTQIIIETKILVSELVSSE